MAKKKTAFADLSLPTLDPKVIKKQIQAYQKIRAQLKRQIRKERKGGPPSEMQLQEQLKAVNFEFDQSKQRVANAKAQSKKRKGEIDNWKNWFENLTEEERLIQLKKLEAEIAWRAQEIAAMEAEIAALYTERLQIEERQEMLKQQLNALKEGVYDRPLEEDPRLKELNKMIDQLETSI